VGEQAADYSDKQEQVCKHEDLNLFDSGLSTPEQEHNTPGQNQAANDRCPPLGS